MKIAENTVMLKVTGDYGALHPTLVWDDKRAVLIDACCPGQGKELIEAISAAGVKAADITDIILTHQDVDHIGCVQDILDLAPSAAVWAHEEEIPYLDGRKAPIKTNPLLNENGGFKGIRPLRDGDVLPVGGGIEVLHTPGHTPGHICLFLRESETMVCGDAANIMSEHLIGANPQYTFDLDEAAQSIVRITTHDMSGAVTYHGGYLKNEFI